MKLISLNTWRGHEYTALMKFIGEHKGDTDIFCFQEMTVSSDGPKVSHGTRTNLLSDVGKVLVDFVGEFAVYDENSTVDVGVKWAQATFIRRGINIMDKGSIVINESNEAYDGKSNPKSIMQHLLLEYNGKRFVVCNIHGVPYPGNKLDTSDRVEQSEKIKFVTDGIEEPIILCGDFNLLPETESIKMLEERLENLVVTHKILTTRSRLSKYFGTKEQQNFADYMFVSSEISVEEFSVPDIQISDHLPMILRFLV